jgi:hypothetical protein
MRYRYQSQRDDSGLRPRLLEWAREKPRFGYRRLWVLLARAMRPRPVLTAPNQEWAVDFASDVAASGRRLRIFRSRAASHARWPRSSSVEERRWRLGVITGWR